MPAINFKSQFADAVESGEKRLTIRKKRKNPIKAGDKLILYVNQRTLLCRKLNETRCSGIKDILITEPGFFMPAKVYVNGYKLSKMGMDNLAIADGFSDRKEFIKFFEDTHGLPFEGDIIYWK